MTPTDVQRLLAAAGHYRGAIDGVIGPQSLAAIDRILSTRADECVSDPAAWSARRRLVGAAQLILKHAGYPVGVIDGYAGNQTAGAFLEWNHERSTGQKLVLDQTPTGAARKAPTSFPRQSQATAFFGQPGPEIERQIVNVEIPLPLRIDFNLSQHRRHLRLHRKCADSGRGAMEEIVRHYGEKRWRELGLDRFAGDYVHRNIRGGASWSQHAFAGALDWFAGPNGLTVRCPQALFCGEDYVAFFDIWEAHGWTSLGRAIGRDWMHVQALGV